jgi:hypothetical protein
MAEFALLAAFGFRRTNLLPALRAPRKITFSPGNNSIQTPWKDLVAYFAALDPAYPRKR